MVKIEKWKTRCIPFHSLPCVWNMTLGVLSSARNIRYQGSKQFPRWIRWRPWAPGCGKSAVPQAVPCWEHPHFSFTWKSLSEAAWFWTTNLGCSCFLGFQSLPGNLVYPYCTHTIPTYSTHAASTREAICSVWWFRPPEKATKKTQWTIIRLITLSGTQVHYGYMVLYLSRHISCISRIFLPC